MTDEVNAEIIRARSGMTDFDKPRIFRRAEMTASEDGRDWTIGGTAYRGAVATACTSAVVELPPGFTGPATARSTEHALCHVSGRLVATVDKRFEYALEEHDLLYVPAFIDYSVANVGDEPAIYVCANLARSEWPGRVFSADSDARLPYRNGTTG
jgi:uncharacterized RmlC-like cupin family protein